MTEVMWPVSTFQPLSALRSWPQWISHSERQLVVLAMLGRSAVEPLQVIRGKIKEEHGVYSLHQLFEICDIDIL